MDKMTIYNAVRSVPKEAQKEFNNGRFKGTDINPMWRIKTLTEQFGPAGKGWYIKDVIFEDKVVAGDTITICQLDLYVKFPGETDWSMPIHGVGGNVTCTTGKDGSKRTSDEAEKMAYTDAISVACKALGIGADVYYQADRTKYTAASVDAPEKAGKAAKTEAPAPAPATGAKVCTKEMYDKYVEMEANGEKLKSGKTAKQGWIDTFHPSEADIKVFDLAVRKAFLEDLNG